MTRDPLKQPDPFRQPDPLTAQQPTETRDPFGVRQTPSSATLYQSAAQQPKAHDLAHQIAVNQLNQQAEQAQAQTKQAEQIELQEQQPDQEHRGGPRRIEADPAHVGARTSSTTQAKEPAQQRQEPQAEQGQEAAPAAELTREERRAELLARYSAQREAERGRGGQEL